MYVCIYVIYILSEFSFTHIHGYLDISWTFAADSLPLHKASGRNRIWNLWFPSVRG